MLLATDALQHAACKRILIVRGEGGRELLAETLKQRGARVEYAEVYRRRIASASLNELLPPAQRDTINIIIVTSNEILSTLVDMAKGDYRTWLLRTPLAVIGMRTAALARELGFTYPPIMAKAASDAALMEAIEQWGGQR
jgi:uroporphyrinogen-III synthase